MRPFDTNRWVGLEGLGLVAIGVGIITRQPSLVAAAAVFVGYAAYVRFGEAVEPSIAIRRTVDDPSPEPGDEVAVTLHVTNEGGTIADLRLVDDVPPALEVTEGVPRLATALRPGKSAAVTYRVTAVRGEHVWESAVAITRNPSGSRERESHIDAETTIRCRPEPFSGADLPLRGLTTQYAGQVTTDVGGSGIEFHSTREYRHGDPLRRIDWNRYARSGALATLELHEERAATVVLLVDARPDSYLAPDFDAPNAVERSVEAAGSVFAALIANGDRVGIAAASSHDCWLPPGAGASHRARAREVFGTHPALAPTPNDDGFYSGLWLRRLRRRLPADAQVVFFSPLCDDYAAQIVRRLDAHGHLVTVISPDPTASPAADEVASSEVDSAASSDAGSIVPAAAGLIDSSVTDSTTTTPGRVLVGIERRNRHRTLRRAGIRVVDWGDEPLAVAVAAATRRWSR